MIHSSAVVLQSLLYITPLLDFTLLVKSRSEDAQHWGLTVVSDKMVVIKAINFSDCWTLQSLPGCQIICLFHCYADRTGLFAAKELGRCRLPNDNGYREAVLTHLAQCSSNYNAWSQFLNTDNIRENLRQLCAANKTVLHVLWRSQSLFWCTRCLLSLISEVNRCIHIHLLNAYILTS